MRYENGLNDGMLYGERQPHGLSKRLSMNELKDIYRNIAAQIQIKTKCMVRQKQSHELSEEKQLAVCL